MMRLALVDDSVEYLESIRNILSYSAQENGWCFEIVCLDKSRNLIYELEEKKYFDLYFLDIEMQGINGLELARRIRKVNSTAYIIFLTSHSQYAIDGYEVSAYRYLLKENMKIQIPEVLKSILKREVQEDSGEYYQIVNNARCEKFRLEDIIRISKDGKNTIFTTRQGVFKERGSLGSIMERLPEGKFVRVDQGNIVNIACINGIEGRSVLFEDGSRMAASRSNISKVKEEVGRYWGKV